MPNSSRISCCLLHSGLYIFWLVEEILFLMPVLYFTAFHTNNASIQQHFNCHDFIKSKFCLFISYFRVYMISHINWNVCILLSIFMALITLDATVKISEVPNLLYFCCPNVHLLWFWYLFIMNRLNLFSPR